MTRLALAALLALALSACTMDLGTVSALATAAQIAVEVAR